MTEHVRDDTLTGFDQIRAQLLAHRGDEDQLGFAIVPGGLAALGGGGFVLSEHTTAYHAAGVPDGVGFMGALAGQLVVLGLVLAATALLLYGDRRGYTVAAAGGVAAVAFALLPGLVAGRGWLTVVLLLVVALVLDAVLSLAVFFTAFFGGLGYRPVAGEGR